MIIELVREPIDVAARHREIADAGCGAVLDFLGVVRDQHYGRDVLRLEYTAYEEMALAEMRKIGEELEKRWPVRRTCIVHRLGTLEIGEASILIAIALPHRKDGFDALRYAIDTFKETVPIWKKEFFADGEATWVEGS